MVLITYIYISMANLSWLTFRDLEYIFMLEKLRHFGRAAAACHVSQPALSHQIAKIEKTLGTLLFERTQRKVMPTASGAAAAALAYDLLDRAKGLETLGANAKLPFGGRLQLAAIATLGPYYLPHAVPILRRKHAALHLILEEGLTEDVLGKLFSGSLDIALLSDTFPPQGLEIIPLFWEPFHLMVPKAHALALKSPLVLKDLDIKELILLRDGHCLRDEALGFCNTGKKHGSQRLQASSLETLRQLVALGEGYTLVPALSLRHGDPLDKMVRYRHFTTGKAGRTIVLAFRKGWKYAADARNLAQEFCRQLPAGVSRL